MHKQTIKYTNFNNEEKEAVAFFHLTRMEMLELEVESEIPLTQLMQFAIDSASASEIIAAIKLLVLKSYGVKSADGENFVKDPKETERFAAGPVFDQLFFDLMTDAKLGAKFVNGIFPNGIPTEEELKKGDPSVKQRPPTQDYNKPAPKPVNVETRKLPEVETGTHYVPQGFRNQGFGENHPDNDMELPQHSD